MTNDKKKLLTTESRNEKEMEEIKGEQAALSMTNTINAVCKL